MSIKNLTGILALVTAIIGVGYWAQTMDYTKKEVEQQRAAIVKIGEQVTVHITKDRYQRCFNNCIPPEECPPEPEPLPRSRCVGE